MLGSSGLISRLARFKPASSKVLLKVSGSKLLIVVKFRAVYDNGYDVIIILCRSDIFIEKINLING